MPTDQDLIAYMAARKGRFSYANTRPAKLYPDRGGFTDCSGIIAAAYRDVAGIDVGDMSYRQATAGRRVASGRTVQDFRAIMGMLRPGDIVAMSIKTGYRGGEAINHVEMFDRVEGGVPYSWGHGGYPPMGPTRQTITASWLLGNAAFWEVRRVLPDQPTTTTAATPTTETETETEETRMNTGIYYKAGDATICAIVNTTSGFFTKWSTATGGYNNPLAAAFDTGSFAQVTESHFNAIERDCRLLREGNK
ncbi:hypothetical protein [Trueperella abortisuis]|uniref:hypothetical protein n=1 Tax=Trueperella abortisuis TaxID=445930 RepID=UPI0028934D60|nr:hypothetical protein [Trueperella abortisuis]